MAYEKPTDSRWHRSHDLRLNSHDMCQSSSGKAAFRTICVRIRMLCVNRHEALSWEQIIQLRSHDAIVHFRDLLHDKSLLRNVDVGTEIVTAANDVVSDAGAQVDKKTLLFRGLGLVDPAISGGVAAKETLEDFDQRNRWMAFYGDFRQAVDQSAADSLNPLRKIEEYEFLDSSLKSE